MTLEKSLVVVSLSFLFMIFSAFFLLLADTKKIWDYVKNHWDNLAWIMMIPIIYFLYDLIAGPTEAGAFAILFVGTLFILFFIFSLLLAVFEKKILRNDSVALSTSKMSLINFCMIIGLFFVLMVVPFHVTFLKFLKSLDFETELLLMALLFCLAKSCFIILFYKEASVKWKLIMLNIAFAVPIVLVAAKILYWL
jgi:hypothetical protein